jgi:hypothetical protein
MFESSALEGIPQKYMPFLVHHLKTDIRGKVAGRLLQSTGLKE